MAITNQFRASLDNQISLIEHELLQASRVQIGTTQAKNGLTIPQSPQILTTEPPATYSLVG